MHSFKQYLNEEKNLHLEHIEDEVLNNGVDGTRQAINFLRGLRDILQVLQKRKAGSSR